MNSEYAHERRNVLKTAAMVGGMMLLDSAPTSALKMEKMMERRIPISGEALPVVGLGSWQQFDVGAGVAERDPLRGVLSEMKVLGGRVIDASPMYGRAQEVIGDLTSELKMNDQFFMATKVWITGRQAGIDQMNDSLKKMGRKKMDLMQVHNLQDYNTHIKTLRDWKEEGKIRYIGITHYVDAAHQRLEQIIKTKAVDFVQFNYSIRSRNAEKSLLAAARDQGVAVLINEPFDQGALFRHVKGKSLPPWAGEWGINSWAQFFLKYILGNESVTCVIPGTSDVRHLKDNLGAAHGRLPDAATRQKMVAWLEASK